MAMYIGFIVSQRLYLIESNDEETISNGHKQMA